MGNCSNSLRAKVIPGVIRSMDRVDWDAAEDPDYLELGGVPLQHFVQTLGLPDKAAEARLLASVSQAGEAPDKKGDPRPFWSRGVHGQGALVEVFSWNVGSLADGRSSRGAGIEEGLKGDAKLMLASALGVGKSQRADVIVVGLQEVISLSIDNVVAGPPRSSLDCLLHQGWPETVVQWVELLKESINSCVDDDGKPNSRHESQLYVLFGQPIYLFGMLLCVFCLPELVGTHIHQFSMFEMPADKHESGVKGVVACRFSLYDRSFCFINCHFHADTSHTDGQSRKDLEERLQQMQACLRSIEFRLNDQMLHPLAAHRAVFLLGDTNMRLSRPTSFESWSEWREHVLQRVATGELAPLAEHDQLRGAMGDPTCPIYVVANPATGLATASQRKAKALREPTPHGKGPHFPPTYKLAVPGPGYSPKRVPAWTDRILFRGGDVRPLRYEAVQQEELLRPPRNITDHNPIYALFEVDCLRVNKGVLQVHVQRALRDTKGRASTGLQHLSGEQERHFRWRFVNTGRPHIELLAQRIFDMLKEELEGPELTLAADKLVTSQQHCWRLVCDHMEVQLREALERRHDLSAVQMLDESLHEVSQDLTEALSKHVATGSFPRGAARPTAPAAPGAAPTAARGDPAKPACGRPQSRKPPRQARRVCILCWAPCHDGLWRWAR